MISWMCVCIVLIDRKNVLSLSLSNSFISMFFSRPIVSFSRWEEKSLSLDTIRFEWQ